MASKKETVDKYVTYIFLTKLTMPFNKWDAFKRGIIDKNGNQVRDLENEDDHHAWGYFDRLAANLKKQLVKMPGGAQSTANFYVACKNLVGGADPRKIESELKSNSSNAKAYLANIQEDGIPTMAVGDASGMAGLDNNPPVNRKKLLKRVKNNIKKRN
jgi:hypothetical protein